MGDSYEFYYTISDIMYDLSICGIDTGPDEGIITFVKERDLLRKIRNIKQLPANDIDELREKMKKEKEEYVRKKEEKRSHIKKIDPYEEEDWEK